MGRKRLLISLSAGCQKEKCVRIGHTFFYVFRGPLGDRLGSQTVKRSPKIYDGMRVLSVNYGCGATVYKRTRHGIKRLGQHS